MSSSSSVPDEVEVDPEVSRLKSQLRQSEDLRRQAEENMRRAAELGKGLLEQLQASKAEVERLSQERHEAQNRLDAKCSMEKAW